jgi:adhesin HecA-like repeat protein
VVIGNSPRDTSTVHDSVLGNSIFGNSGPGIDLGNNGPTANFSSSPTAFPNNGQNAPVLTGETATSISGTLTTRAGTYRIEFFASPRGSVRQGKAFLGFITLTLAADGSQDFTDSTLAVPAGMVITATATNMTTGDTSEFS